MKSYSVFITAAALSLTPLPALAQSDLDASPNAAEDASAPADTRPPPTEPVPHAPSAAITPVTVEAPAVQLLHEPRTFVFAREPLELHVDWLSGDRVSRAHARYRVNGGPWQTVMFARGSSDYVATIPAVEPDTQRIEYYIEALAAEGAPQSVLARFASAAAPQPVLVRRTRDDAQEIRDWRAYDRTRAEVFARGEYVDFGNTPRGAAQCPPTVEYCVDWYYHLEGSFRFRFYRVVRSIRFGVGHMRGYTTTQNPRSGVMGGPNLEVGADYGLGEIEFGFSSWFHGSAALLLGANARSVYPGAILRVELLPTDYTTVTFGWWGLLGVGNVIDAWLRWNTVANTPMGAGIELSNLPGANSNWGARLLFEIARQFGRHFVIGARGGYQARTLSAGSLSAGGYIALRF